MRLEPDLLLFRRRSHGNRIAAEKSRQHRGRDSEIDARHLFANAVDVERSPAHAPELFRNKEELDPQLFGAAHVADDVDRALVAFVEFDQRLIGRRFLANSLRDFTLSFSVF